jgi:hypothetical protein
VPMSGRAHVVMPVFQESWALARLLLASSGSIAASKPEWAGGELGVRGRGFVPLAPFSDQAGISI